MVVCPTRSSSGYSIGGASSVSSVSSASSNASAASSTVSSASETASAKVSAASSAAAAAAPVVELKQTGPLAPGSAGELKLYDTDPRDAAMIMAIVADSLGKPLNELRFISIREVREDEV